MHEKIESLQAKLIFEAVKRGFYIKDGILYKSNGEIQKCSNNNGGYPTLSVSWVIDGLIRKTNIAVHRLSAYFKYGNDIFNPSLEIQHLDNNKTNFRPENLELCSHQKNMMNTPSDIRMNASIIARTHPNFKERCRFFTEDEIRKIRKDYEDGIATIGSLSKLLKKPKSTISYIINRKTYKDVH